MAHFLAKSLFAISFVAANVALNTVEAVAEEPALWAEVDGWDIRVDRTLNNGCFAIAFYEGGSAFRIGLNMLDKSGYVVIGDTNWKSLEQGKDYDISFQFGNEEPWTATANVFAETALIASFSDPDFLQEFAKKHSVRVFYNGRQIAALKLKGSYKALNEVLRCQSAITEASNRGGANRDPFASDSVSPAKDPFAY